MFIRKKRYITVIKELKRSRDMLHDIGKAELDGFTIRKLQVQAMQLSKRIDSII